MTVPQPPDLLLAALPWIVRRLVALAVLLALLLAAGRVWS